MNAKCFRICLATLSCLLVYSVDLVWKPERKSHSEDIDVDGNIILEWILGIWDGKLRKRYIWVWSRTSARLL